VIVAWKLTASAHEEFVAEFSFSRQPRVTVGASFGGVLLAPFPGPIANLSPEALAPATSPPQPAGNFFDPTHYLLPNAL